MINRINIKVKIEIFSFTFEIRKKLSDFGKYNCKFKNFRLEIWSVQKNVLNLQSQN